MLKTLTIQRRLSFTMLFLGALLALVALAGIWGMRTSNAFQRETSTNQMPSAADLQRSQVAMLRGRLVMDRLVMHPDAADATEQKARAVQYFNESDKAFEAYRALPSDADEQQLAAKVAAARQTFYNEGINPLRDALDAHDASKADAITMNQMARRFTEVATATDQLIAFQDQQAAGNYTASGDSFNRMMTIMTALFVLGVAAAALSWWTLRRAITRPLQQAVAHFDAIAGGDLTGTIHVERQDEMGQMMVALRTMQERLIDTMGSVRTSGDQIATATQQIAAGNQDLSQRTEEQAASLEETASSMEEMTATVKHNADNARQAARVAEEAGRIAHEGGAVVEQVVTTMGGIASSSKKVADILAVIDSIAFQTNILALNAAVEAARAGEQGRGFAVVAGEVRVLAQRSATAAKEIKALIDESTTQVEHGSSLVTQAGSTMTNLTQAVRRVTDIMQEISAASHEQSEGIDQVNKAVAQMDEVTQQNAALVEEAAAAASSLDDQAQRLRASVAVFRLPGLKTSQGPAHDAHAPKASAAPRATYPGSTPVKALAKPTLTPVRSTPSATFTRTPSSSSSSAVPTLASESPAPVSSRDDWETF